MPRFDITTFGEGQLRYGALALSQWGDRSDRDQRRGVGGAAGERGGGYFSVTLHDIPNAVSAQHHVPYSLVCRKSLMACALQWVGALITTLSAERMAEVERALALALGMAR